MSRSNAEIKSMVEEVEQGWSAVREKARKARAQLYTQPSYLAELESALLPEIDVKVAFPSRRPDIAAWHTEGILAQSLQFHVEPAAPVKTDKGGRTNDGKRADKGELFFAHEWEMNLNQGGKVLRPTYRYQAVGPFAPWWMEYDAFALPEEKRGEKPEETDARRKDYRKRYSPFKLTVLDPLTVSFEPDDNGLPTVACRKFQLPYHDFAERYGEKKGKDANPLTILNEQFPLLRGGRGVSIESGELYSKMATVWVVDNGSTICHYVEVKGDSNKQYEQLGDDYDNPWGCPSLIVVTGRYNVDAEALEDRYEGLISDLLREQRNVDVLFTHAASLALTPNKHAQQLTPEVVQALLAADKPVPNVTFDGNGWATLIGDHADIGTDIPDTAREIILNALVNRDAALPAPFLTNPDQAVVKSGTAAAQLNAHETSSRSYDSARTSTIAGIHQVCMMMKHFICGGHVNKKGTPATESIRVVLTGKEPSKLYSGSRKGEELTIEPGDFDEGDVLEITAIASTQSQKSIAFELKLAEVTAGVQTPEDLIATITEDVSGTVERLEEWNRYQKLAPVIDQMDLLAAIETIALKEGRDYSLLFTQGAPPPPQDTMGGMGNGGGGMGVQTTAPPPTAVADVGVTG